MVVVAAAYNKLPLSVVVRKELRAPADLVGKKFGIVNFGGSNDLGVTLALKEWNIPRSSVTILAAGGVSTGTDAVEFLMAGASAIQVGTATKFTASLSSVVTAGAPTGSVQFTPTAATDGAEVATPTAKPGIVACSTVV